MTSAVTTLARTITYGYDELYHLTDANYTSGEQYQYSYDPVGNRLQQIIDGDTTAYLYDAANRLTSVDGVSYTFDDNGNLLTTGVQTNTFDAANRLIATLGWSETQPRLELNIFGRDSSFMESHPFFFRGGGYIAH